MADIQAFINEFNGHTEVGDTPENTGQCVGLDEVWLDRIGAPHIWGNACDMPANADRGAYVVTPNTFEFVPEPGDIGCLPAGWGGSSVGHTFIVAPGTTQQMLIVFEQNDHLAGGDGSCRVWDGIGWPDGLTFIHPVVLDPAPAAPVTPVVDPTPAPVVPAPVVEPVIVVTTPDPLPTPAPVVTPPVETPVVPVEPVAPVITVTPVPDLTPVTPVPIIVSKVKHMPKYNLHQILSVATYVITVAAALVGYLNSVETVSLLGLVTVLVTAIERTKLNTGN
jgi:hypothetical protein